MNITLFDVSGSLFTHFDKMVEKIKPNDYVVMFDHNINDIGFVRPIPVWGGGGTCIKSALEAVAKMDPSAKVTIITDGYFNMSELDNSPNLSVTFDWFQP